jgi:hypothetical protein
MFTLKFDTDTPPFLDDEAPEIARILRAVADDIEQRQDIEGDVRDAEGNSIGQYELNAFSTTRVGNQPLEAEEE